MAQIIAICKREELPMAAQFYLKEEREDTGEPMYCTTVIRPCGDSEGLDQISFIAESMQYGRAGKPWVAAYTVRTEGGQ
ncbi:hypothetical protein H7B90_23675 [Cohnella xylanilytica]|uniref:Uncharacterized protein n=2 Tax=Cohnella xylanilytica TaxID=557555 RepID=A0A841U8Q9_9BACL|nr:hypothetical protein [Cohnella xylanilytica]